MLTSLIVLSCASMGNVVNAAGFTDISNHWAKEFILFICDAKGVMAGKSSTKFAPEDSITRAEFVTVLGQVTQVDRQAYANNSNPFKDVPKCSYYEDYVKWAYHQGIVAGQSSNVFGSNSPISRQDVCVMMDKYFVNIKVKLNFIRSAKTFPDNGFISPYARTNVSNIYRAGLINGNADGYFRPGNSMTRAETTSVLYNVYMRYLDQMAYSNRNMSVRLAHTQSYLNEYGSTTYLSNRFNEAVVPFKNRWNLSFRKGMDINKTVMPEDSCSNYFSLCTSSCSNDCTSHHKNFSKNVNAVLNNVSLNGNDRLIMFTSATLCRTTNGKHNSEPLGVAYNPHKKTELRLFSKRNNVASVDIGNVRLIQHEFSHLFGVSDPTTNKCYEGVPCIMSGGYDMNSSTNLQNIWCPYCQNEFNRNAN